MDNQRRLQKFSIRKYTIGTCSILIGTLLFLGNPSDKAFASEKNIDVTNQEESVKPTETTNDTSNELSNQNTNENVEQNNEAPTDKINTNEQIEEQSKVEETDNQTSKVENETTQEEKNTENSTYKEENTLNKDTIVTKENNKELDKPENNVNQSIKTSTTTNTVDQHNSSPQQTPHSEIKTNLTEPENNKKTIIEKNNSNEAIQNRNNNEINNTNNNENNVTPKIVKATEVRTNKMTVEEFKKLSPREIFSIDFEELKNLNIQAFYSDLTRAQQKALALNKSFQSNYGNVYPAPSLSVFRAAQGPYPTGIAQEYDFGPLGDRDFGGNNQGDQFHLLANMQLVNVAREGDNAVIRYKIKFNDNSANRGSMKYYFAASEGNIKIVKLEKNGQSINTNKVYTEDLNKTFRLKRPQIYNDITRDFIYPLTSQVKVVYGAHSEKIIVEFEVRVPLTTLLSKYEDPTDTSTGDHKFKSFVIGAGGLNTSIRNKQNTFRVRGVYNTTISPTIHTDLTEKANTKTPVVVYSLPGLAIKLYDKSNNVIGEGVVQSNGKAPITPTVDIPEGDVTARIVTKGRELFPSAPKVATRKETDADRHNPTAINQTVEINETPSVDQSINLPAGTPNGTRYEYITQIDTRTVGDKNATVRVTYPDNSYDDVPVVIEVIDTTPPVAPTLQNKTNERNVAIQPITIPNATDNSGDVEPSSVTGLPPGLTYNSQTKQITGTPTTEGTSRISVKYVDPSGNSIGKNFKFFVIDTTPPNKPVIQTDLTGKAGTTPTIAVNAEPRSNVKLYDKDGNKIGEGVANDQGVAQITPTTPLTEGNITAKATDNAATPNTSVASDPIKSTDTTPPAKPVITTDLTGKAGTTPTISVNAEAGSNVELFDKNSHKIGQGVANNQGVVEITPTTPLTEGNITAKATDNAETPNTSVASDPIKATDTTAPAKPVITTDLIGKAGTTPAISVNAEPGSNVELFDKNGHKIGQGVANNQGVAQITPTTPLPEGNITAKATDNAETPNTSVASDPIKATDTTAPAKPVITTNLTGQAGNTPTISVNAEAGSNVELFDKNGHKIGQGVANNQGVAQITPTTPLPEGNITAKATDNAETPNTSVASDPIKATDTTAPAKPVITTDLSGKAHMTPTISVNAEPGSNVELFDKDGNKIGEAVANDQGIAQITPTTPLPEGNITAKATDNAETPNTSDASDPIKATDTTAPAKPVITTDLTGKAGTTEPITVTTDPGSNVELFDKDGNKIGEGVTNNQGIAQITPTTPLPEGNITAKATDNAETPNTSDASDPIKATDTTAPVKPVIITDLTSKAGTTNSIVVNAEPNSKVEIFDKDGNKIGEAVANDQGIAQITPTTPLPEGNITAKATDNAESPNTSDASDPIKATDTTAPVKPVITTDLTGQAHMTPTISVNAEPGSTVEIFDKDGNKIGEGVANDQGVAEITPTTPLPEGNITAKATDNAESPNTSDASDSIKATDTTAPVKPVITTDLTGKAHMTPIISVNAEPGSNVELFDKDGNKIGEAMANDQGVAKITPTMPLPEGNITTKATDNAETPNTSDASDPIKATDTTAPAKPVITTDLTGQAGTTPTISVNAEPGSNVEIFDKDGNKIGEAVANNQGVAEITPTTPLPEGNITAKATDNAEVPNTSDASDPIKATDTTAPVKPVITTDLTGKGGTKDPIVVNAEPGSTVELFDKDGNKIGEGIANDQGIAEITPTTPLPEGNITAKATDNAETPNTSDASDPVKAIDTTPPTKPVITTDLTDKGGTKDPISVTTDPGSKVELFDKNGNKIGEGVANDQGVAEITPSTPLPEGNVTAKATDNAETPNTSDASDPVKSKDITPPSKPVIQTDLSDKGGTKNPIVVNAEPNSKVELFDKDGNKIGEGVANDQGIAEITPTIPLPEGNITAKATDNAETPNTSDASDPVKSKDITPPSKPVIQTDLTDKGGTKNPIVVNAEPGSTVELFDKDGNKIGEGIANDQGIAEITPTIPLPEGNITAKATDNAETPNTSDASDPVKSKDITPPSKPVIQTDLTDKGGTKDPIVVNAEPGSTVELFDKDGNKIGEGIANDQGIAEITPTIPLPEGNITAKATDNAETPNTSVASDPVKSKDITPPTKPVIQTDLTDKGGTKNPIVVNAEPGSTVELFDKDGNKIGEGIANDQGVAEITPTIPLPEGNITAKATDNAETTNTSDASDPIKATDTTAPVKPVITTDLTGQAHMTPTISVNAEPGSNVELFDKDGNKIGEGVANDQGVVEITPTTPLPEGNITAKATDNAETPNTSDASDPIKATDTTAPVKPVITTDLTGQAHMTPTISVNAEPGSNVELFDKDGNKIGEGVANDQGIAEITPTTLLPEGNITAKATDNTETPNTSEASDPIKATDTTAPTKPVITTDLTGQAHMTPTISVNAEPGSNVELFDKDGNKIGEAIANDQGVAEITPTTPLPEGNITAKATDNAEAPNTSDPSDPIKATDTTAPAKPVITTDLTDKGGTKDPIVVNAEPHSKVELFDKDGNKIGEGVANDQGIAEITPTIPLPEGNITAKATDNAETPNTSDASDPVKSKDITPPSKPVIQTDLTDKGGTKNPIVVNAEPGSTVELFDKDGNKIGEGIANDQGIAEITPTTPLPEGNITAKATDNAETPNTSDASDPVQSKDTTPPTKPVIQTDLTDKGGTKDPIVVNAEPNSKVELFDKDGNKIGEGIANDQGVTEITPSTPLPEGNIIAKATDNAETPNTSDASDPVQSKDTTPPTKPVIQTDLTDKGGTKDPIVVNAEPNSKVELFDKDGNKIGEGIANDQGVTEITPSTPLPEGNIIAKATDNAETPNTSDASEPVKAKDITPPTKPVITTDLTDKGGTKDPIVVNAEPNSKVELFDKDGNKIGEGIANDQGVTEITPSTPLPEGNITAKATDNAETPNTSDASNPVKSKDTTPPTKPVIQTDLSGKGGTKDPIVVNAEPGSTVELFDKDGNKIGEGIANDQGVAEITPTIPLPEGNITTKATDNAETPNTSDTSDPVKSKDTTPPTKPVITTDLTDKGGTKDPIVVNAEPHSKVELFDKDGNKIGEGVSNDQGIAEITPSTPLPEGNITAKATDNAETPNTSDASEPVKSKDTTPPTKPVIQTDLSGKGGTKDPITVTTEPGSKVELFDKDGNKIGEGVANDQGVAEITPTIPLPEGNITAKATDNAEMQNTSDASDPVQSKDTTPPTKPVIQTDLSGKGGTKDPISVTTDPGSKVELFDKDGNKIGEGVANDQGVAEITPTTPLPEGNITAKATDNAETPNTSDASDPVKSKDTTPPTKPVITTDLTDKGGTKDPITVTTDPGSKVELFDKDGNKIGEGVANDQGIAEITPTIPLPEGNITAKATDNAEMQNTSDASDPVKSKDTTPPSKPVIQTDLTDKGGTKDPISVTTDPGTKVEIFDKDGNKIGEGVANDQGVAEITPTTPLPEGNITAKATDNAETPNTSDASEPVKSKDTTPPTKPVIQTDLTDKGGTKDPIVVKADPGSTVELFDKDGNKIGEGVANDQGVAEITPTTPLPEGNITAKATDNAETPNTSDASDPVKAKDTTPPTKPVIQTDLTDKGGTKDPIVVKADPGSKVELFDKDGNKIGEGVANDQGVAEITPTTPLPEGNITAKATDNAETPNTSDASEPVKSKDTTPPTKPVIQTDLTGKGGTKDPIVVKADPGSKVELFDKDGNKIGEGIANDQGVVEITPTTPLPEGNITAKATDNAETPNTSDASEPVKSKDTTPPTKPVIQTDLTDKGGTKDPIVVKADPGSTVELFDKDGNKIGEGVANDQGVAEITPTTPLPEGNIIAKATDNAETPNTSDASEPVKSKDTTPPTKPVIQTDLTGKGGTKDPIVVKADPGSKVELFDKDGNKIGEGIANDQGVVEITPTTPLPEGNITAKATDNAETPNTSDASEPVKSKDTTPPTKPVIQTDLTDKGGTKDPIVVKADPESTVELFDKDGNKIGEGIANDQGIAEITPTTPLPEGNIIAKATDNAETPNTSDASEPVKSKDTTPPTKPVIQTDLTDKGGTKDPIVVKADPGSTVELFDKDGNKIGEGVANDQGVAEITPTTPLPEGNIVAKATDNAETPNTSDTSDPVKSKDTTPPTKPVIQTDLTDKGGTKDPIVVKADPGSTVELFDKDGNKIGEGVANDQGVAKITPTKPLPEGNIIAKATDNAETPNTSDASEPVKSKDTTPPTKPVITTDLTDKGGTKDPIVVKADPGSKVELFDKDGNKIGEGVANDQGIAEITPTKPLPEGNIIAKATDNAETPNTSDASEPVKSKDTTPPTKPVIQTDLTGKGGTKDPIIVKADPGSKVELFDKDGNKIGEGVANDQGVAEITPTKPLPEGNITAKATDNAETPNTSDTSKPIKSIDTTQSTKPDTQTDLTGKASTKDPIIIISKPGYKVEIFDKDGNKVGEGVANDQGIAEIIPTAPLPENKYTAKVTGKAESPIASNNSKLKSQSNPTDMANNKVKDADKNKPGYGDNPTNISPDKSITIPQIGDGKLPKNTKFEIPGATVPSKWDIKINSKTGALSVTPPGNVISGTKQTIPVKVTYPDGSTEIINVKIIVTSKENGHDMSNSRKTENKDSVQTIKSHELIEPHNQNKLSNNKLESALKDTSKDNEQNKITKNKEMNNENVSKTEVLPNTGEQPIENTTLFGTLFASVGALLLFGRRKDKKEEN